MNAEYAPTGPALVVVQGLEKTALKAAEKHNAGARGFEVALKGALEGTGAASAEALGQVLHGAQPLAVDAGSDSEEEGAGGNDSEGE
jgi:acyl-CoA synthetase (NDP forming)